MLTFDGAICGGPCSNYALIDANYGSEANLTVSYNHDVTGVSPGSQLQHWDSGYSNLTNVAWGGSNDSSGRPAIILTPAAGYKVTLTGFDFGAWPNTSRTTSFAILSGSTVLYNSGTVTVDGATALHFGTPFSSTAPLSIQWGPSGYNVGIDNVAFRVEAVSGGVPEPSTWAMMLIGFAGLGWAARRRRVAFA
ncbi:MAG: PEP-CTERM sorting domain-containing protein [Methylobacteriaceae bacterium]|nr:PEP-CTERM sorting domain-containing protein [Methylobacteriaceae bacterium]